MPPPAYRAGRFLGGFYAQLELPSSLFESLPDTVSVNDTTLNKKSEFHVTLVHAHERDDEIRALFDRFVKEHPIRLLSFDDDVRHAAKDGKETILVRCTVSNLEVLFQKMREDIGINLPVQPTHVTLYTLPLRRGVAIDSAEEMEALSRVSIPEISAFVRNSSDLLKRQ